MNTVAIGTSHPYEVRIAPGLLSQAGPMLREQFPRTRAAVISDSTVWPLYGKALLDSLGEAAVCHYVISAGEASKNGENFLKILNFLAENHLTRSDYVIALGGGVVGDLTGFAAACYLRGIAFVQIPTTLLADVDSSVGGKTAIDLPAGKNLAGAFHQPSLVLCDTDTLKTLPEEIFLDGCAEVIKYGVLYDPELFAHLEQHGPGFDREYVITRCVEWKNQVVSQDEFDRGARQKLNLGHTFGHGIEQCSGFRISHGQAVATGMAIAARCARARGLCSDTERILRILEQFGFALHPEFSARALANAALSDKKRSGDRVSLILPHTVGDCEIVPIPVSQLESWIEEGI